MKIGLDGNEANVKDRVGSGVYAFEMLKQFSNSKKHKFTIYLKDQPVNDLPKETEHFKYKTFGPKKLWTRIALPINLFIGEKLDVFFTLGHYGPRFSKSKYCVTIFDLSYIHFPKLFKKNDLYQLTNWSKNSVQKSSHIFAISQSTKNDITRSYGISQSKISVTLMGYDGKFKPQSSKKIDFVKNKYKIHSKYIIFVGTLQPRKNIEKLIEAYSKIRSDHVLVVVGKKGWLFESIFKKVKDLNLEKKVIFTDFVPGDDLPALLSGATIYILPSLWEGFGIPVIEAQACKVPVIVSDVSSLPEIVGDSGLIIDSQNTRSISRGLEKMINDPKLRTSLINKGSINVKRFSWEKCADQTLKTLEKVAST